MSASRPDSDKTKNRFVTIEILIVIVMLFVVIKLLVVMFKERSYWNEVAACMVEKDKTIEQRRGNILSDEGLLMAGSMPQYRIFLDFASSEMIEKVRKNDQLSKDSVFNNNCSKVASVMHSVFPNIPERKFVDYYTAGHSKKNHYYAFMPDGSPLSYLQYKELVTKIPWLRPRYEGWFYSKKSTISRKRPFGELAARTLGDLYGAKDSARYGLELSFDSVLRGKPGIGHEERLRNVRRLIPDVAPEDGCDIVTTINVKMQDVAESALRRRLEELNAYSGVAVLMEVSTGNIKAMTSLTRCDDGRYREIQNNVARELYEPGSTFKTVSMMVALDAGLLTLDDSVFCEMGEYSGFGGVPMTDSHPNGWLTTTEVLMQSSNIGTAKLISKAYKGRETEFVEGILKTGIGTHFTMQLTGTASPSIRKDVYWDATRLPWMSFGYNVQLPVVNTLAFYNGIANGGRMIEPRLVTEIQKNGHKVKEFPVTTVTGHMCKESTLKDIKYMLEQVVEGGTGTRAGSDLFKVAGKTGTAQISHGASGYKNGGKVYLASFCGYFPADEPEYTCIVAVQTPYGDGSRAAGPVFREIAESTVAMTSSRSILDAVDTVNMHLPKVFSGDLTKAHTVLKTLGIDVTTDNMKELKDSMWGTSATDDAIRFESHDYLNRRVPNVTGMGASDAVYLLEKAGLSVSLSGVGHVYYQSLAPGSDFRKGNPISIRLRM